MGDTITCLWKRRGTSFISSITCSTESRCFFGTQICMFTYYWFFTKSLFLDSKDTICDIESQNKYFFPYYFPFGILVVEKEKVEKRRSSPFPSFLLNFSSRQKVWNILEHEIKRRIVPSCLFYFRIFRKKYFTCLKIFKLMHQFKLNETVKKVNGLKIDFR